MDDRTNRRSTLADVAKAANVSKTTASMALNGKGRDKIPATTIARVQAAAGALHFRPHGVARALVRRRADVLGVVCTVNPFVEMCHHAFEQAVLSALFYHALEAGYNPMIYGVEVPGAEQEDLGRYIDGRSDAFILLYPSQESPLLRYLQTMHIPVVALCSSGPDLTIPWVDSDNATGIRLALEHLIHLDHRHIGYIVGPDFVNYQHIRLETFRRTLQEHGLPVHENWIVPYAWETDVVEQRIAALFEEPCVPDALLTWNDSIAEVVYTVLRRRGLRIPEDVSLIGFDDIPSARAAVPTLTTIRQDVVALGGCAVKLAIQALSPVQEEGSAGSLVCPVELIVRQSTERCRSKKIP